MSKPPRVVAELGRPETPDEMAGRKAASRAAHRANQTLRNLLLSLGASLGIVVVIIVIVLRTDPPQEESIDVAGPAADASAAVGVDLVAPDVPEGWAPNAAELRDGPAGIASWYVGYVTAGEQFASLTQGVDADGTWLAATTREAPETGSITIDGIEWSIADQRETDDVGNLEYVMTTVSEDSTIVLAGTADDDEMQQLAEAVSAELADD